MGDWVSKKATVSVETLVRDIGLRFILAPPVAVYNQ